MLAALPERERLVERRLPVLEPLDDLLELLLGLLEGRLAHRVVLDAGAEAAFGELDVDAAARLDLATTSGRSRPRPGRSRTRARASSSGRARAAARSRSRARRACARRAGAGHAAGARAARPSSVVRARRRAPARVAAGRPRCASARAGARASAGRSAGARCANPSSRAVSSARSGTTSLPGRGRRGGPHVGGEVAERRVLLVADGADDGNGARRDRAHEPLVAERQQVVEAPAAACEHDDVDALRADLLQRRDHRERGARTLHERLRDDEVRGREARRHGGDHVALRRGVVAGDEPDLAAGGTEAGACVPRRTGLRAASFFFSRSSAARWSPSPKRSMRQRAQLELALRREELGSSVDVHALAVERGRAGARRTGRAGSSIGRHEPSVGSFSVRKTFAQALWRRSSVTSPSIQIVGRRAIQSATPRLNDATV